MAEYFSFSFCLQMYVTLKLFKADSVIIVFGCCMIVWCTCWFLVFVVVSCEVVCYADLLYWCQVINVFVQLCSVCP